MGKLFYIMGKSSTGKDTIYKSLLENQELQLKPFVMYTTRPMRSGETPGLEYYFTDEDELAQIEEAGKLIEMRAYHTVHGIWKYFTADTDKIDLKNNHYIMIGVLSSFQAARNYYGETCVIPIYIEVEDGERLQRALDRERAQEAPQYAELCRRFLTDSQDFAEEQIQKLGIEKRFSNKNLQECIADITTYISEMQTN